MRTILRFSLLTLAMISFNPSSLHAQGKPAYDVFRLAVPGAVRAGGIDLNDSGNVIGDYLDASDNFYSFFYRHATKEFISLGADMHVLGMNQSNQIVGYDGILNIGRFWNAPDALPIPLLPLPGHMQSRAHAINNAGIIVGTSYIPEDPPVTPGFRAIVAWRVDANLNITGPVVLPFVAGHLIGAPNQLTEMSNGVTTIVGHTAESPSSPYHAVQWSVSLDNFGVPMLVSGPTVLNSAYAYGLDINAGGDVVGLCVFAGNVSSWPYLKRNGQPVLRLPGIARATYGAAYSINDAGRMVGYQGYHDRGVIQRAVLWTSPTIVVDLNSKVKLGGGESLTFASRMNSRGDILAKNNVNVPCLLIAK